MLIQKSTTFLLTSLTILGNTASAQTSGELGVKNSEVKGGGLHGAEHAFGQKSATS